MTRTSRLREELLDTKPLLFDGPMGTQLLASGFDPERDQRGAAQCLAALNLSRLDQVRAIHESWLERGARALRTHTFAAHPSQLAEHGLEAEAEAIHRGAAEAARAAVEFWGESEPGPAAVVASFGPAVAPGADQETLAQVASDLQRQVDWLVDDCDGIVLETFSDVPTLASAVEAVRPGLGDRPLLLSVSCNTEGKLWGRGDLEQVVAIAERGELDLLALNCGTVPLGDFSALRFLRERWSGPLGWWPNAGAPGATVSPEDFAATVSSATREFDLAAVGACCGSLPAHLGALASHLDLPVPTYPLDS